MPDKVSIRFPILGPIWSTNLERGQFSRWERAANVKAWRRGVRLYARNNGLEAKCANLRRPLIVTVHIPFKREPTQNDPHNYCGTIVKSVIDGIKDAGVVPDDNRAYIYHREPILYKGLEVILDIEGSP